LRFYGAATGIDGTVLGSGPRYIVHKPENNYPIKKPRHIPSYDKTNSLPCKGITKHIFS